MLFLNLTQNHVTMKRAQLLGIVRETISMHLVICESFVSLTLRQKG